LSKPNVSVRRFLDCVPIPSRNLDNNVTSSVRDTLAPEAGLQGQARGLLQLVEFFVGGFVARFEAFADDDMAGGAGTDAPAGMLEGNVDAVADVQNRSGLAAAPVRDGFGTNNDPMFFAFNPQQKRVGRLRLFDLRRLHVGVGTSQTFISDPKGLQYESTRWGRGRATASVFRDFFHE